MGQSLAGRIDKSRSNATGIKEINNIFKRPGTYVKITTVQSKHLNNIVEQNHRFTKRQIRLMLRFKSFQSAAATLDGIEVAQMIRKGQFGSAEKTF